MIHRYAFFDGIDPVLDDANVIDVIDDIDYLDLFEQDVWEPEPDHFVEVIEHVDVEMEQVEVVEVQNDPIEVEPQIEMKKCSGNYDVLT